MIHRVRNKKGVIIPLFVVFLTAMLGLAAAVIDMGQAYMTKTKIQNGVDFAVLAAGPSLNSGASVSTIKNTALTYLNNNLTMTIVGFSNLDLTSSGLTLQLGDYNSSTMVFTVNEVTTATAIKVEYSYASQTIFAPVLGINNLQVISKGIVANQAAGMLSAGHGFPFAILESALTTAASNSNVVNLDQGSMGNSYWTAYTAGNPSAAEVRAVLDYIQYMTGTSPPALSIGSTFNIDSGNMTGDYMDMDPLILEGQTHLFPVVTESMNTATVAGFIGATISDVYSSMGSNYVTVTILPNYTSSDLSFGSSATVSSNLLAGSRGLVE